MINECKAGLTDIVVVKNISRLGRDTVEVLDAINTLREAGVRIIFKQEELDIVQRSEEVRFMLLSNLNELKNDMVSKN